MKQAVTELGQAQLKLGLKFILIFCRFGFSRFGLGGFSFVGLIRFGLIYLVQYIWFFRFQTFCLIQGDWKRQ